MLVAVLPLAGMGDSLFSQQVEDEGTLIAEATARYEVGDIITVLVREEITASTSSDTNTRKESDVNSKADGQDNTFLTGTLDANGKGEPSADGLPAQLED